MAETKASASETLALLATEKTVVTQSKVWPQHLAAILASLVSMATGTVAGWSSPAIPFLQGNMGVPVDNPITDEQASWVGSIVTLGCLVGAVPAGTLSHRLGRRVFLMALAVPLIIGWMLIIYGENNVKMIYLGRFINGLSFGAVTVAVPLYNNEIAEDRVRGSVGVYLDLMLCVGILWSYVVGAVSSYYWLSVSCLMIPVLFLVTFFWMPESPVHLLAKGKAEDAEMALRWLRGAKSYQHYDAGPELAKLQRLVDEAEERSKAAIKISDLASFKEKLASFSFRSTTTKAVGIAFGLMTFQRLSGVSAVVYYTVDIFRGAGTSIAPTTATIIVGVVSVIASATSACLVDRLGRRFLLILSDSVMAVSLAVMGVYFAYKDSGVDIKAFGWLPVVVICLLISIFRAGLGPIPWFMLAEVLPTEVKPWATSAVVCYTWLCTFLVTKSFLVVVDTIGFSYTYLLMSSVATLGLLFFLYCVPETKNRTPQEIRELISRKKRYMKIHGDVVMGPVTMSVIPVVALSVHTIAFRIGLGCVPWFMVPELIPAHAQYWANSLTNFYSYIALFAVLYFFIWSVNMVGFGSTFFFFAGVCSVGTVFIYFIVPETKLKSKEHIQHELKYGMVQVPMENNLLPVVALSTHLFAYRFGLSCVPWFMIPELIPKHSQWWANSLTTVYSYIAIFFVLFFFVWGVNVFGEGTIFFLFSASCAVGTLFIYFCVPETKCKSNEQIQHELKYGEGKGNYRVF